MDVTAGSDRADRDRNGDADAMAQAAGVTLDGVHSIEGTPQYGYVGRQYMETYHDAKTICENIIALVNGEKKPSGIIPIFFRNAYKPENPEHVRILNSYTAKVSTQRWYKDVVPQGTREGLIF